MNIGWEFLDKKDSKGERAGRQAGSAKVRLRVRVRARVRVKVKVKVMVWARV